MRSREVGGLVLAVCLAAFTIGCQAPTKSGEDPVLKTTSGRPQITVLGASMTEFQTAAVVVFIGEGWVLRGLLPDQLTFEKQRQGEVEEVLKLHPGREVWGRAVVRFAYQPDDAVRAVAYCALVFDRGSASEKVRDQIGSWRDVEVHLLLARAAVKLKPEHPDLKLRI